MLKTKLKQILWFGRNKKIVYTIQNDYLKKFFFFATYHWYYSVLYVLVQVTVRNVNCIRYSKIIKFYYEYTVRGKCFSFHSCKSYPMHLKQSIWQNEFIDLFVSNVTECQRSTFFRDFIITIYNTPKCTRNQTIFEWIFFNQFYSKNFITNYIFSW